jgi:hypothetical protein
LEFVRVNVGVRKSHIEPSDFDKIFGSKSGIISGMIKNVNLNPDKPQFHNVYYGDMKSAYGDVYRKNGWGKKDFGGRKKNLVSEE